MVSNEHTLCKWIRKWNDDDNKDGYLISSGRHLWGTCLLKFANIDAELNKTYHQRGSSLDAKMSMQKEQDAENMDCVFLKHIQACRVLYWLMSSRRKTTAVSNSRTFWYRRISIERRESRPTVKMPSRDETLPCLLWVCECRDSNIWVLWRCRRDAHEVRLLSLWRL